MFATDRISNSSDRNFFLSTFSVKRFRQKVFLTVSAKPTRNNISTTATKAQSVPTATSTNNKSPSTTTSTCNGNSQHIGGDSDKGQDDADRPRAVHACGTCCGRWGDSCWNLMRACAMYPGIDMSTVRSLEFQSRVRPR
jgi:hypothetical protein